MSEAKDSEKEKMNGSSVFGTGYYVRCVIIPVTVGAASIVFGFLKEPERIDHWSYLWKLVNLQPKYAIVFGGILIYLAARAYFRAQDKK